MKKIKLTKEQYNKLVKAGLIKESANVVDKEFRQALAGKKVHNLKYIPEEKIELGSKFNIKKPIAGLKNMTEAVNNLLEYIYGLNENFSTFWESYDLTYEDICETLESKGYLVKKEGSYRVSKKMGDAATVKEGIAQTISEMLKPIDEDYPAGAAYDSSAPYNRPDPEIRRGERATKKFVDLKYSNPEIAIFRDENSGEMYVFYYGDIDQKVFEPYAERQGFIDPDGDVEYYDDFDVDDDTLENYVNDNFPKLTKGVGPEDFESGKTDLVLVDEVLKDELLRLYDKDSRLVMALEPIAEATGAASSGAYTGLFSPSNKEVEKYDEKKLPPVVTEMDSADAGNFAYDNPGFVGISRDGKFPTNQKKTKAQKNTQWAGGAFVEMDDCTKLNNNKEAQKGKCSTGAVDNVVKLRKTKGNINAPSLAESIETEVSKLLMVENAAEWEKAARENIANTFASMPKLKDLKEYGLKYSVKAIKNLLVDKYEDGKAVSNKWKREHMLFPQELDILNAIIQSRLAVFYFKTAQKERGVESLWNWANQIKKEDIDNFPIPPSVFQIVKDELTATENNPFKVQNNPPKLEESKKYTIYKLDRFVKKNNINTPSLSEGRIMREALKLQHDKNEKKLVVVSDLEGRAGSQETFHNKAVLRQSGFEWTGRNWAISVDKLELAKKTLSLINKAEYIIDKLEDLEDAVENSTADNKDLLKARLDQYIMDLANATDEASLSAEIRRYLTFFSKFRGYSYYNRILIYIQKPDATKVGSFNLWKSKHRRIKKGAKAIKILAPAGEPETIEYDDETSELMGQLGIENKPQVTKFKAVNVFDISDTVPIDERGEVPETPQWWGDNTPSETAEMLYTALTEVAADLGTKVTQSDSKRGEKGYSTGTHINISSDVEGVAKLSVALHELAHDLMHWKKSSIYYIDNGEGKTKTELEELQAESVSYVVLKHYGIPAKHHATYLALWKANKDKIQKNLEIISKVSQFIIKKIDEYVTKE